VISSSLDSHHAMSCEASFQIHEAWEELGAPNPPFKLAMRLVVGRKKT